MSAEKSGQYNEAAVWPTPEPDFIANRDLFFEMVPPGLELVKKLDLLHKLYGHKERAKETLEEMLPEVQKLIAEFAVLKREERELSEQKALGDPGHLLNNNELLKVNQQLKLRDRVVAMLEWVKVLLENQGEAPSDKETAAAEDGVDRL